LGAGYYSDAQGPFGRNVESTTRIRAAIREQGLATPIIVAGGMHRFEQAEAALADGTADIVAFARQALADPDWFRKVLAAAVKMSGSVSTRTTARPSISGIGR
jgi:2,4-dienoyl-CoA reductase-like NADH-dependent reductase (Old Yellow Enzyme family)